MIFTKSLGFIGAGRIAQALIVGLVQQGYPPQLITVSNPHENKLSTLKARYPDIQITTDNSRCAQQSALLVLAVKPKLTATVLNEIRSTLSADTLLISVAAGVRLAAIMKQVGATAKVIRAMPNTPAVIAESATGLLANAAVTAADRDLVSALFTAIGSIAWVDDDDMLDKVTAIAGSGPAYVFYVLQAFIRAAEQTGLAPSLAKKLIVQTVLGSVKLAANSEESLTALREQVTSPGGTTAAGVAVLEQGQLPTLFAEVFAQAYARGRELGRENE